MTAQRTIKLLDLMATHIVSADAEDRVAIADILTEHYGAGTRELCDIYVTMLADDSIVATKIAEAIVLYSSTH